MPILDNPYTLRIYPNPNPGSFTLEPPQPADANMSFRITDLTGRLVLEQQADIGSEQQYIQQIYAPMGCIFCK